MSRKEGKKFLAVGHYETFIMAVSHENIITIIIVIIITIIIIVVIITIIMVFVVFIKAMLCTKKKNRDNKRKGHALVELIGARSAFWEMGRENESTVLCDLTQQSLNNGHQPYLTCPPLYPTPIQLVVVFEMFIPLVLFVILLLIREKLPASKQAITRTHAMALPSTGLLSLIQMFCDGDGDLDPHGFRNGTTERSVPGSTATSTTTNLYNHYQY
ncbi:hypothetical protein EGW08_000550 [Elysia chlorotica]|uniref:Uncharacterized protein n=1 Tax=Elysia chlorotica TaxID=188477 RepID=A0A3S1BY23_ELYCH|nr:hypothetical protein EGW08_000550 [Elysia chlorotica]